MDKKNFITKDREKSILSHTPMGRYGKSSELIGADMACRILQVLLRDQKLRLMDVFHA